MEIKRKGKVHPSPSPSSSSSVFKLLPAAILALISVLSLEEREVLAYMIARSIQSSAFASTRDSRKKSARKASINGGIATITSGNHKTPMFSCDCFYCYTAYWCRWDSSPNRDLIHHAIDAFEDHLPIAEKPKNNAARAKRRHRIRNQAIDKSVPVVQCPPLEPDQCSAVLPPSPERDDGGEGSLAAEDGESGAAEDVSTAAADHQKGLATIVVPDVLRYFKSRFSSLWNPNTNP